MKMLKVKKQSVCPVDCQGAALALQSSYVFVTVGLNNI